jgi:hypothetical protein
MAHYRLNSNLVMKISHYFLASVALALLVLPGVSAAQTAEVNINTTINASSSKPGPGVLQKMRAEVQVKGQNIKANQDSRNEMRVRVMSTSTSSSTNERREIQKAANQKIQDLRTDLRDDRKMASTSVARREFRAEMELRMFEIRKEILIRQLNLALNNLKQIRARIASRIEKAEQSGRNMTEAKSALVTADAKLGVAQTQIGLLANLSASSTLATSTTATSTATTTAKVKLEKPRMLGEAAIKAVKDARDALNQVVRAIAKNMGLGGTATTTLSVGTTTATTTASTTTQ